MASSSIPFAPSPLAREPRDKMNPPSSVAPQAQGFMTANGPAAANYGAMPYPFGLDNNGASSSSSPSSSSKARGRQQFTPYTTPGASNLFSFSNNPQFSSLPGGFSPFQITGPVPNIPAPPATGPCPLAQPIDIASLNTPGLDNTSGNDTSVTASPTSPTGTTAQPMYAGYFPSISTGYAAAPQNFLSQPSGESSKPAGGAGAPQASNNWSSNDASDWEDPSAFGGAGPSRMPAQRAPASFPTDQIFPGWAPAPPGPHPFATPASSSGSPTSPLNQATQSSTPVTHHEPPPPAKKVPRPPNAWILYRSDMLAQIRSGNMPAGLEDIVQSQQGGAAEPTSASASEGETKKKGKKSAKGGSEGILSQLGGGKAGRGLPQADISKMISVLWKREAEDVRRRYEQQAELKKMEHQKLYPNYKFQPVRKEEKLAQRAERAKERDERRREKELYRQRQRRRMRGRHTPPAEDEGHHVSGMARSNSYHGPEGQPPAFQMAYGGWGATTEESDGEAMQMSLAQPISFDTSLLQVPFHLPAGMPQIPVGMGTNIDKPPSPERSNSNGNTDMSSSFPDSSEWASPQAAAYLASQRALLSQNNDGSRADGQGELQFSPQDPKDPSIYVFNPPNLSSEIQLTDPEALAALWCKLEPEGIDALNASPINGPTPSAYTFPTPPLAQPVDIAAWDAYDPPSNSLQIPILGNMSSSITQQILRDWAAIQADGENGGGSGSGMSLTPDFQASASNQQQQQQQQQQSNTNFQRTLAPTPSFSAQASPVDGNFTRASPVRPTPWNSFVNASPGDFGAAMSGSGTARNPAEAYSGSMTMDANGNMSWHGRNVATFGPTGDNRGVEASKDVTMDAPNVSVGLPVSISDVSTAPAARMMVRPRQVASKYEAVAGA